MFLSYTSELDQVPEGGSFVQAAREGIMRAGYLPRDMKDFPSAELRSAELCREEVDRCAAWVGVIGFRYGSPVRDDPEMSYTGLEVAAAEAKGLPMFAFLLAEDATGVPIWAIRDVEHGERQEELRTRIDDRLTAQRFTTADGLRGLVQDTLRERLGAHAAPSVSRLEPVAMAPPVAEYTVDRSEVVGQVLQSILDAVASGTGPEGRARAVAITTKLQGAGGFGKTTLARIIANDSRITSKFPGGVLWWTFGQDPDVLAILSLFHDALTKAGISFASVEQGAIALAEALRERACLVILDDVWESAVVRPFERIAAPSVVLITTRIADVAPDAARVDVDEMASDEAVEVLLARLPERPGDVSPFRTLAARLGEWPLILGVAAGALATRVAQGEPAEAAVSKLTQLFDQRGPARFARQSKIERDKAVGLTIEYGLGSLAQLSISREQYAELAIFPEDVPVDFAAVAGLWMVDELEADDILGGLDGLSLVELDRRTGTFTLHDVVRVYLAEQLADLAAVHRRLVDAVADPFALPDGYLLRNLAFHLVEAGWQDRLVDLVDVPWMLHTQRVTGSHVAFAADVQVAWAHLASADAPQLAAELRLAVLLGCVANQAARLPVEVFEALARDGQAERALSWAALVPELERRAAAMAAVAPWASAEQRQRVLRDLLSSTWARGGRLSDSLHQILDAYLEAGDIDAALLAATEAEGDLRADLLAHVLSRMAARAGTAAAVAVAARLTPADLAAPAVALVLATCFVDVLRRAPETEDPGQLARSVEVIRLVEKPRDRLLLLSALAVVAPTASLEQDLHDALEEMAAGADPMDELIGQLCLATVSSISTAELAHRLGWGDRLDATFTSSGSSALLIGRPGEPFHGFGRTLDTLLGILPAGPQLSDALNRIVGWVLAAPTHELDDRLGEVIYAASELDQKGHIDVATALRHGVVNACGDHPTKRAFLTAVGLKLGSRSAGSTAQAAQILSALGYDSAAALLCGFVAEELAVRSVPANVHDAIDLMQKAESLLHERADLALAVIRDAAGYLVRRGDLVESIRTIQRFNDPLPAELVWETLDRDARPEVVAVVAALASSATPSVLSANLPVPAEDARAGDPLAWTLALGCIARARPEDDGAGLLRRSVHSTLELDGEERLAVLSLLAAPYPSWRHENTARRLGEFLSGAGAPGWEALSAWLAAEPANSVLWSVLEGFLAGSDPTGRTRALDEAVAHLATAEDGLHGFAIFTAVNILVELHETDHLLRLRTAISRQLKFVPSVLAQLLERDEAFRASWEAAREIETEGVKGITGALEAGRVDIAVALAEQAMRSGAEIFEGAAWVAALSAVIGVTEVGRLDLLRKADQVLSGVTDEEFRDLATTWFATADWSAGNATAAATSERLSEIIIRVRARDASFVIVLAPRIFEALRGFDVETREAVIEELRSVFAESISDMAELKEAVNSGKADTEGLSLYGASEVVQGLLSDITGDRSTARALLASAQSVLARTNLAADPEDQAFWHFAMAELACAWHAIGDPEAGLTLVRQLLAQTWPWFNGDGDGGSVDLAEWVIFAEPVVRSLSLLGEEAVPAILDLVRNMKVVHLSACAIVACLAAPALAAAGESEALESLAATIAALANAG